MDSAVDRFILDQMGKQVFAFQMKNIRAVGLVVGVAIHWNIVQHICTGIFDYQVKFSHKVTHQDSGVTLLIPVRFSDPLFHMTKNYKIFAYTDAKVHSQL